MFLVCSRAALPLPKSQACPFNQFTWHNAGQARRSPATVCCVSYGQGVERRQREMSMTEFHSQRVAQNEMKLVVKKAHAPQSAHSDIIQEQTHSANGEQRRGAGN